MQLLTGVPILIVRGVEAADLDGHGYVDPNVCLRWCEDSRREYLAEIGLGNLAASQRYGLVVSSMNANFRRAIASPDNVHIGVRVGRVGHQSIVFKHRVCSESQKSVAVEAEGVLLFFDYQLNRPANVPDKVRSAIERLESQRQRRVVEHSPLQLAAAAAPIPPTELDFETEALMRDLAIRDPAALREVAASHNVDAAFVESLLAERRAA